MYSAKVLLDSVNQAGERLTTYEVAYPQFGHQDMLTHGALSFNAASTRAIPLRKAIEAVVVDPAAPVFWGKNQPGMMSYEELEGEELYQAKAMWAWGRDQIISVVSAVDATLHAHKQWAGRMLQPYAWITCIISATDWWNFFELRQDWGIPSGKVELREMLNPRFPAQPEVQVVAYMMRELYLTSKPVSVPEGGWHLPLYTGVDDYSSPSYGLDLADWVKISAGRCARVTHLTHDGVRDPQADIALHDTLMSRHEYSPFEHQARAASGVVSGNFRGWEQYRKMIVGESGQYPPQRVVESEEE